MLSVQIGTAIAVGALAGAVACLFTWLVKLDRSVREITEFLKSGDDDGKDT